jgi:dihydrofolate reductase
MRKVILAMQITVDGFACGPNDEMEWLIGGDEEWREMFRDLASVDTCLVGSKMFPGYAGYWRSVLTNPNANKNELEYARYANRTPHVVFSKSESLKTEWPNTRFANDPKQEITQLKQQPGKNIIVWGGADFASSLIKLGLLDEYRITLNPTLLGAGKTPFHNIVPKKKLQLIDARPLKSGNVILRYGAVH